MPIFYIWLQIGSKIILVLSGTLADANTKRDYRIFEEFADIIVQKKMNIERSIYEMLQICSISLTDTTNLKDLFAKPNYNIVNELDGSTEPSLF